MKRLFCLILAVTVVLFSGCVEKSIQANTQVKTKDTIVYSSEKIPQDLSLLNNDVPRDQDIIANVFEGLVKTDEKGNILPGIAESWSKEDKGLCYKFKIRDDAAWSDGSKITANDFAVFFSEVFNKDIDNIYTSGLNCIINLDKYREGVANFDEVGIKAMSDNSLEIRLNNECSYLLNILSEPVYGIRKMDSNLKNYKSSYNNINYSGAYVISNINADGNIILSKNKNYYDRAKVNDYKIEIIKSESPESSLANFKNGKIDIFLNPPIIELDSLISENKAIQLNLMEEEGIAFNIKSSSLVKDKDFRKALSLAIDRNKITKEIMSNSVRMANSFIPQQNMGNYLNSGANKENAINMIKSIKINNSNNNLKLIYINSVENKKVLDFISKSVKEYLNVNIQCEGMGEAEFNKNIKNGKYDMALIKQREDYNSPVSLLEKWMSASCLNIYGYKNSQYDSLIIKSRIESDDKKRINLLSESEKLFLDDMPYIPLYFNNIIVCKDADISGMYVTFSGCVKFDKLNK